MLLRDTGMRRIARPTLNPSLIVVVLLLAQLLSTDSAAAEKVDLKVDTLIFADRLVRSDMGQSSTTLQRVDAMRQPGRAGGSDSESSAGAEAVTPPSSDREFSTLTPHQEIASIGADVRTTFNGVPGFSVDTFSVIHGQLTAVSIDAATLNTEPRTQSTMVVKDGSAASPEILDIDGDGTASALTDGLLVIRRLFGFSGEPLVQGATGEDATLTDPVQIAEKIDGLISNLDIDQDGETGALTDGLMIIRHLFGFSGASLTEGAISADATRTDPEDIKQYLEEITPVTAISNDPPEVSAGVDQVVVENDLVSLVAEVSDEGTPAITWSQVSGTPVTLSDASSSSTGFTAPQISATEQLTFQVSVDDGVNSAVVDTIVITVNPAAPEVLAKWIINTANRSTRIFESASSSLGVLEDVQLVNPETVASRDYAYVEASGIPNYDVGITQKIIDELNSRPRLGNDFVAAATSAVLGSIVKFGEDIGYRSSTANCLSTGGDGYWPPGPACPTNQSKQEYLAVEPVPTATRCETGLGAIGLMVNGTSIYNWGDGQAYGNGVWYNLAPIAEQYDVDICGGHAPPSGDYHHHFYTSCLADLVADEGDGHSPIYGFAADGYALYGPFESAAVLAVSGWQMRDYGAASGQGGCATQGQRSCVLNDVYDLTQGVSTVTQGPDIGATVTTLSGNSLAAADGYYLEDYYYSGDQAGLSYRLDEHNGHDNSDGRGYHYHITLLAEQDKLVPRFPFTIGPEFYGDLPDNAMTSCGGAGGGPPQGPPP